MVVGDQEKMNKEKADEPRDSTFSYFLVCLLVPKRTSTVISRAQSKYTVTNARGIRTKKNYSCSVKNCAKQEAM